MMLKAQDVLVLLKLVAVGKRPWTYNQLSFELGMSPSEVHAGVKRALAAGLAIQQDKKIIPFLGQLEEFIVHGLRYVFMPKLGELVRGIPTAHAGPPLKSLVVTDNEPPPVWPDPEGKVRGIAFSPLYQSAPKAARFDNVLYELLVLVDGIRAGQARERSLAIKEIKQRFKNYGRDSKL